MGESQDIYGTFSKIISLRCILATVLSTAFAHRSCSTISGVFAVCLVEEGLRPVA